MKWKCVAFIFVFSVSACEKNETTFVIRNQTEDTIGGIVVQNHQQKSRSNKIAPEESLTIVLPLRKKDSIVRDGEYLLHYMVNGKKKIRNFGYYTNNSVLNNSYTLIFEKDTIAINQE